MQNDFGSEEGASAELPHVRRDGYVARLDAAVACDAAAGIVAPGERTVISPAKLTDATALTYSCTGRVLRVFDSNGLDEFVPVAFKPGADWCTFALVCAPAGSVYAEVVRA